MNQSDSTIYDAIVVGSGITGGWAAKELTEKGLKVLMLERGEDIPLTSVVLATQKASLGFEATLQVRNKLMKAYDDIMNMPV